MLFAYNCVDKDGKFFDGVIHEESLDAARAKLEKDGWQVLQLEVSGRGKRKKARTPKSNTQSATSIIERKRTTHKTSPPSSLPRDDLRLFTLQMATMLNSGIPLLQCLETLENLGGPTGRVAISKLREQVLNGHSLSQGMKNLKPVFDETYISLVEASEQSGRLDRGFHSLALRVERAANVRSRLWQALTYPAVVSLVSLSMLAFLLYYMFPKFADIFAKSGQELPLLTKAIMSFSNHSLPIFLALILSVQLAVFWTRESEKGQSAFRAWLLYETAWLGDINRKIGLSELSHDLSMMLNAGCGLSKVLQFAAKQARGDRKLSRALKHVHEAVVEGDSLSDALAQQGVFPQMMVVGASVGMETGRLTEWLDRSAESLEFEVSLRLETLTDLLEPIILGVLGVGVGVVVLAAFLPIYNMISVNL